MMELLGNCGLVCTECPAHRATQGDDMVLLRRTAKEWSKAFHLELRPEDILCDGCTSSGRHSGYCAQCGIRACAGGRGVETCAECEDYACEKLIGFLKHAPEAKRKLEQLRNPPRKASTSKRPGTKKRAAG